jgi:AcrR family transcriptional regulator
MTLAKSSRGTSRQNGKPAQTHRFMAKREAILDAAARQFNKYGLKGATLADVAGSVDLLTNSVTYYYRRKEDLVAACLLRDAGPCGGGAHSIQPGGAHPRAH